MNTKQAKDFLAQQTTEQAALEKVPLSPVEKRMMYFTESDSVSCENPLELNDEFEAECDTGEYEVKIARLLRHAYDRLKVEDPERKRMWDQAVHELRKGDHYFLVLWDLKVPSERPRRDLFKLLGVGLLVAVGIGTAAVLAAKYNIDLEHYRKYVLIVVTGLVLLATGFFRLLTRIAVVWYHRRATKGQYRD
jgi:hypothetical protein